ncbi:MAG: cytochrome P450 [Acidobacteriota bacterium]
MASTLSVASKDSLPAGRVAPGPAARGFAGSLPDFRDDKIGFLMGALRDYGEIVRFRFGPKVIHLLQHPDHVKLVLGRNHLNFAKASRGFNKLKSLLGNGLVTSDGSFWQRQRRIAQPAFHRKRIAAFAETMTAVAEEFADRWEPYAESGEPLDLYPEMNRLTFNVVMRTLLGADLPPADFDAVSHGLEVSLNHMNRNIYRLFDVPSSLPTRRNREFRAGVQAMDDVVYKVIAERRKDSSDRIDLLSMMMQARDEETGEQMLDEHLRDEVMTIMLAGHETTAIALTWTWYLLSTHPREARRLRAELAEVLGGRTPTIEDVPRLPYTTQVAHEALRLYPPLWAFSRLVKEEFELGGYQIPANSTLFLSPYVTHRHPEFWENPEGFDPERFAVDRKAGRHPYAFLPFGGGPRNCIGSNFAILEMQMALATLAQRFRPDLLPGHHVEVAPILTLRPNAGMPMVLQRVNGAA